MQLQNKLFFLPLYLSLFFSCTANRVAIKSIPEGADVNTVNSEGEIKKIGLTPLEISEKDLYGSKEDFAHLQIAKKDYAQENVVFVRSLVSRNVDLSIRLQKDAVNNDKTAIEQSNERIATTVADINDLMSRKRYDEVENKLNVFVEDYPGISVGYDFMGNFYYVKRNFKKSLDSYQKAMNINPANMERKKIIDRLKEILKGEA